MKNRLEPTDLAAQTRLYDVQWQTEDRGLVWLEGRSDRGVLVWNEVKRDMQADLTREHSVRAGIGYGGGDFTVGKNSAYYVSQKAVFGQPLDGTAATCILSSNGCHRASPVLSPDENYLLYLESDGLEDRLHLAENRPNARSKAILTGHDFYMQPCWHPDGSELLCVCWNHPNMPWDGTAVMRLRLDLKPPFPRVAAVEQILGDPSGRISFTQCRYSPDGTFISVVGDESGWNNVRVFSAADLSLVVTAVEEAEQTPPSWVQGIRSYGWNPSSDRIYFVSSRQGFDSLKALALDSGRHSPISNTGEYTSFSQPAVSLKSGSIALIGSAPDTPPRILLLENPDGDHPTLSTVRSSSPELVAASAFSVPSRIDWQEGSRTCFGLYYAPCDLEDSSSAPPAMLKVHGGPTNLYRAEFEPDTQFFVQRGWAVLELNYRGSWGFGREYRDSLAGNWGESDVKDTCAAAQFLIRSGLADPKRIILAGGSAGGLTVLLTMIHYPGRFRAGIVRYGVADLRTLTEDTHKFEKHYLEGLVGSFPEHEKVYEDRSPLSHVAQLQDPLALFQGTEDPVVPQSQSDSVARSLSERGVPHLYRVYEGESHGWKQSATIADYYQTVEDFLTEYAAPFGL